MEYVLHSRLKYLLGGAAVMVLIALYFVVLMVQALSADESDFRIASADSATLIEQANNLQDRVSSFEDKVRSLETALSKSQNTIEELRKTDTAAVTQCDSLVSENSLSLEQELATVVEKQRACQTSLTQSSSELASESSQLREAQALIQSLRADLSAVQSNYEQLQVNNESSNSEQAELVNAQLAQLNDENTQLLTRISELEASIQRTLEQSTADTNRLQTELVRVNQENIDLQNAISSLQVEKDKEEETSTLASTTLTIVEFTAKPNYCARELPGNEVCLASIDINATFNFSPNGFISLRLIDPEGDTIQRQSVAGRSFDALSFTLDENEPSMEGEYRIEFKIDDVFNKFSATERFVIKRPSELTRL